MHRSVRNSHFQRSGSARQGFTLIELAIVLVIIGLIVGGVLVGRDLIQAAELRKIAALIDQYRIAVNTFRLKYNALPGDMPDATNFWGFNPEGCPYAYGALGDYVTGTCNGNGNGIIGPIVPAYSGGEMEHTEWLRFWHHLSNAELISGKYWCRSGSLAPTFRTSRLRYL